MHDLSLPVREKQLDIITYSTADASHAYCALQPYLRELPAKDKASSCGCPPVVRSADWHGKAQQGTAVSPHDCSEKMTLKDDPIPICRIPRAIHFICLVDEKKKIQT